MSLVGGSAALPTLCASTFLPASAILHLGGGLEPITLTHDAIVHIPCPTIDFAPRDTPELGSYTDESTLSSAAESQNHQVSDFRDPFYATQFPMCYALAATTITAYMLVVMLFITPQSFLDGGIMYLGRRGFAHNTSSNVNIGRRPWLQKVATLTVAISLTVASTLTFNVAQQQYKWGIQNAKLMQIEVMGSLGLKVIRLISDTFLWLAQAQTLIRIFPRQREKNIIKWVAFALITLDVIFTALNSFRYSADGVTGTSRPNSFIHPVPALSYLFQLTLGILYAAWVIYYAIMKKRYAFYHPLMKNMCLVAFMSIISVLIPVVFFILDISKPTFAAWGDYVRWVGAAAASVVVWEWVERIEALEREEKKDGVLGREVFDGDDTLEVTAAEESSWLRQFKNHRGGPGNGNEAGGNGSPGPPGFSPGGWQNVAAIANRYRGQGHSGNDPEGHQMQVMGGIIRPPLWPARPVPTATPVSRTDTASAASTVYAIRYQPASEATTRTPEPLAAQQSMVDLSRQPSFPLSNHTGEEAAIPNLTSGAVPHNEPRSSSMSHRPSDLESATNGGIVNPSGPRTATPGTIPDRSQVREDSSIGGDHRIAQEPEVYRPSGALDAVRRWDLRARFEDFAANQAERIRDRIRPTTDTANLPVRVIPAPARRGAALQQVLEEEGTNNNREATFSGSGHRASNASTSGDMSQLGRRQSVMSMTSRGHDSLPSNNPPLWPGVQARAGYDDDQYSYDDSMTDTSSVDHQRRDFEDGSGPTRTT
ncbi:unnamed protein product [Clonostachys rhizophaga]|uniref:PH-response regulator protein palH/prr-4 n=1 Tax=Clonostachys rhizophaga TaxID=160324 RepID=A0A9N9VGC7_9HYPO|nr:unnamed protein product [Clonostachys rhizophaga]